MTLALLFSAGKGVLLFVAIAVVVSALALGRVIAWVQVALEDRRRGRR